MKTLLGPLKDVRVTAAEIAWATFTGSLGVKPTHAKYIVRMLLLLRVQLSTFLHACCTSMLAAFVSHAILLYVQIDLLYTLLEALLYEYQI